MFLARPTMNTIHLSAGAPVRIFPEKPRKNCLLKQDQENCANSKICVKFFSNFTCKVPIQIFTVNEKLDKSSMN